MLKRKLRNNQSTWCFWSALQNYIHWGKITKHLGKEKKITKQLQNGAAGAGADKLQINLGVIVSSSDEIASLFASAKYNFLGQKIHSLDGGFKFYKNLNNSSKSS